MSVNHENTAAAFGRKDVVSLAIILGLVAIAVYTSVLSQAIGALFSVTWGVSNLSDLIKEALGQKWTGFLFFGTVLTSLCVCARSKQEGVVCVSALVFLICLFLFIANSPAWLPSKYDSFFENKSLHELSAHDVEVLVSQSPNQKAYQGDPSPQKVAFGGAKYKFTKKACESFQGEFFARPQWEDRYVMFINGERAFSKPLKCSFWSVNHVLVTYTPKYAPNGLMGLLEK